METTGKRISYRQLRAIDAWLRDGRKNKARALIEAGYSYAMSRQPHKVFDSPVVQRELEMRGFGVRGVENNKKPEETIRVSVKTTADFHRFNEDQIRQLKEALEDLPGERLELRRMDAQGEDISLYTPEGIGEDVFSAEAKEATARPKLSSFSAM